LSEAEFEPDSLGLGSLTSEEEDEFILASEALPESDLGSLDSVDFFASFMSVTEAEASDESGAPEEVSIGGVDFFALLDPVSEAPDGLEDPTEESIAVLSVTAAASAIDPVQSISCSFESVELGADSLPESPPVPVNPPVAPVFFILLVASCSVSNDRKR
jgi:hypothetical protein